jgi:hypothetical protein
MGEKEYITDLPARRYPGLGYCFLSLCIAATSRNKFLYKGDVSQMVWGQEAIA